MTQPWAGTGGAETRKLGARPLPQEARSTEGAPELRGADRRHHYWKPSGGLCGTTAHPTLRIKSWRPLARELQGSRVGLSRGPWKQHYNHLALGRPSPGMLSIKVQIPRAPRGQGWGQQGWAWSESSVLRQACPRRTAPRPGHDAWSHTQPIFSFTGETGSLPLGEGRTEHPSN